MDVTLRVSDADFVQIVTGKLNSQQVCFKSLFRPFSLLVSCPYTCSTLFRVNAPPRGLIYSPLPPSLSLPSLSLLLRPS